MNLTSAVEGTEYVTETVNGESITFALDPKGTVYTLPSTAGTKRYGVNEDAMKPILDVADEAFSTSDWGGCFCVTEIDGGKLIYKAYVVDDETQEIELVDTYAIKKTTGNTAEESTLDESLASTVFQYPINLITAIAQMLGSYFKMLFDLIGG